MTKLLTEDAVAKYRPASERTGGVNCNDRNFPIFIFSIILCKLINQRGFPGTRCACHTDEMSLAGMREKF